MQKIDSAARELQLRLEINTPGEKDTEHKNTSAEFRIGFNDFPMIDNTRLPHDQRVAIVLNQFDEYSADITLVYFPGKFASLKEKPYFQEVLNQLMDVNEADYRAHMDYVHTYPSNMVLFGACETGGIQRSTGWLRKAYTHLTGRAAMR